MEPTNPLLSAPLLPLYSKVRLEHLKPAIEHIVADNLQSISRIVSAQSQPTWSGLVLPMEALTARLDEAIAVIAAQHVISIFFRRYPRRFGTGQNAGIDLRFVIEILIHFGQSRRFQHLENQHGVMGGQ